MSVSTRPNPPHHEHALHQSIDNYCTEMCSGSEAGSYLRRIDFAYHSILGLIVIKKKKKHRCAPIERAERRSALCVVGLGTSPMYRNTSLIRNHLPVGPYSRAMPRALWWS